MRNVVLVLASTAMPIGCAAAPRTASAPPAPAAASLDAAAASAAWALAAAPAPQGRPGPRRPDQYATLKGGALYPAEDDLDPGYYFGGVYGHYVNPFLAIEFESGYGDADIDVPGGGDFYAIPMLLNARVTFPVWVLDLYGGGGIGSTYYDFETDALGIEGWLVSWDVFAGAEFVLRERMTVGLELKYHFTEEIERTDDRLDSLAVMATFGWRF